MKVKRRAAIFYLSRCNGLKWKVGIFHYHFQLSILQWQYTIVIRLLGEWHGKFNEDKRKSQGSAIKCQHELLSERSLYVSKLIKANSAGNNFQNMLLPSDFDQTQNSPFGYPLQTSHQSCVLARKRLNCMRCWESWCCEGSANALLQKRHTLSLQTLSSIVHA